MNEKNEMLEDIMFVVLNTLIIIKIYTMKVLNNTYGLIANIIIDLLAIINCAIFIKIELKDKEESKVEKYLNDISIITACAGEFIFIFDIIRTIIKLLK